MSWRASLGVGQGCFVGHCVSQGAVRDVDNTVPPRLAGCNVVPLDAKLLLPGQDSIRGELGAVVADDHARTTSDLDDAVKLADHPRSRGIVIGARVPSARLRPPRLRTLSRS